MSRTAVSEVANAKECGESKTLAKAPGFVSELHGTNAKWPYAQEATARQADDFRYRTSGALSTDFQIAGLPDSETKRPKCSVYEQPAQQALEPLPPLSDRLKTTPYDSPIKLNVQITNVLEVSQGLSRIKTPEEMLNYLSTVSQSGADAVREPALSVAEHLAQPNIVNDDLIKLAKHYAQGSRQFNNDIQLLAGGAIQQTEKLIDQLDKPMTPEQRAEMAGAILPLFFMDGKAMNPKAAQQMGLENMTAEELDNLGIKRVEVALKLERDEFSIKASIPGNPKAFVEAKVPSPGIVDVTYINRGDLPEGMGGDLLAQTLRGHRALPTHQLVFSGIINPETLEQFRPAGLPTLHFLAKVEPKR